MKTYPAVDVRCPSTDLLLALVDDFQPTALEERGDSIRIFFSSVAARDAALNALEPTAPTAAIDVPDEDWARRSQEGLQPVTVGRITILPQAESQIPTNPKSQIPNPVTIVIPPSMGFGTGHHATTRLCLAALQTIDLGNAFVLDVGTGSGVLAIAAARLGAARALGVDFDPDAIQSARENLDLNPGADRVEFQVADLATAALPPAEVLTANLTGALLVRAAATLLDAVRPGGMLVLSGILVHERDAVVDAFAPAGVVWIREEEGWVGLSVKKP